MPTKPGRACTTDKCRGVVLAGGGCPVCNQSPDQRRGNRHARGYDNAWLRLRAWFMAQPENQLCCHCARIGRVERARECDHIRSFDALDDPLRLDPKNLQPLCSSCHRIKTVASTNRQ